MYREVNLSDYDFRGSWVGEFQFKWVQDGECLAALYDGETAYEEYMKLFNNLSEEDFSTLTVLRKE